jgi:hypothetical protein
MVNKDGLAEIARPLILLSNPGRPRIKANQRAITLRGGRGAWAEGGGVGGPNSRSKNDGHEE